MKNKIVALLMVLVVCLVPLGGCEANKSETEKVNMLFVRNSFTFTCDVPGQLKEIARIYGIDIEYEKITPGGVTLAETRDEAIRRMESQKFDYVVLQEHGIREWEGTTSDIKTLCDAAKETGATPVIFNPPWMTDGNKKPEKEFQPSTSVLYRAQAVENGAEFVNAADAWIYVYDKIPGVSLYQPGDDYHANDAGAYYTACVFASTLFDLHVKDVPEYNMYHSFTEGIPLGQAAWEFVTYFEKYAVIPDIDISVPDGTNERIA